ncbi:Cyclin-dependent kinase inhibitor [Heracleum sosnowskyi]|uniref:Cyclin-dependent kinase inhibitor n=1 Tax=Heracleum sosnowskyi TaxID=360622 RepID=A0AAD8MNL8_9APIA|nr:Cyclin-dependent kinase inhibitor [Heracleum sosnowskyi]
MDVTKLGVRMRAEALDMFEDGSGQTKRRKVEAEELALSSSSLTHEPSNFCKFSQGNAIAADNDIQYSNFSSDGGASCCSSNELSAEAATDHKLNSADLQTTTSNQQAEETLQPETTSVTSCHRQITEKFVSLEAELEEFFAAAEEKLRKQFTDKYNYDISKDEPLSGRYEWVPLKP